MPDAIPIAVTDPSFLLICAIVFFGFLTQTVTGFGAMVIAMALGALLYPVGQLLVWFLPLVLALSSYLVARHRQHIDWNIFLKTILPGMTIGLVIGQLLFFGLETAVLKRLLGAVILLLAIKELLPRKSLPKSPPMLPWTIAAGVVQGVFATGGPILVYALNAKGLDKARFRATLSLVWLAMAVMLIASLITAGKFTPSDADNIGVLLGILVAAIICGEWLHHRVNAALFTKLINALLLVAGLLLLKG